jgi:two-component system alkaline phosphatase synthesis response regulator PhoP
MNRYLIKINCSDDLLGFNNSAEGIVVNNSPSIDQVCFSELESFKTKIVLCIKIDNNIHLDEVLRKRTIENLNVPTVFLLSEQDESMIKTLYSNHHINICFTSQPEAFLREKILYMFNNYSFFTGLKSKNILNTINTKTLTAKEVEIIRLLAESPLKELNRSDLFLRVWGESFMNTNTLDVHLCNIRRKLKETIINISSIEEGRVALQITQH